MLEYLINQHSVNTNTRNDKKSDVFFMNRLSADIVRDSKLTEEEKLYRHMKATGFGFQVATDLRPLVLAYFQIQNIASPDLIIKSPYCPYCN